MQKLLLPRKIFSLRKKTGAEELSEFQISGHVKF